MAGDKRDYEVQLKKEIIDVLSTIIAAQPNVVKKKALQDALNLYEKYPNDNNLILFAQIANTHRTQGRNGLTKSYEKLIQEIPLEKKQTIQYKNGFDKLTEASANVLKQAAEEEAAHKAAEEEAHKAAEEEAAHKAACEAAKEKAAKLTIKEARNLFNNKESSQEKNLVYRYLEEIYHFYGNCREIKITDEIKTMLKNLKDGLSSQIRDSSFPIDSIIKSYNEFLYNTLFSTFVNPNEDTLELFIQSEKDEFLKSSENFSYLDSIRNKMPEDKNSHFSTSLAQAIRGNIFDSYVAANSDENSLMILIRLYAKDIMPSGWNLTSENRAKLIHAMDSAIKALSGNTTKNLEDKKKLLTEIKTQFENNKTTHEQYELIKLFEKVAGTPRQKYILTMFEPKTTSSLQKFNEELEKSKIKLDELLNPSIKNTPAVGGE